MSPWKTLVIAALVALAYGPAAVAQQPPPAAFSPEIETAGRKVGQSLRCVVCQNQSIEDSGAPLAADMRRLVRERLTAGDTPDQVRRYMTDRYGNFVLMRPPLQVDTLLLWFGPALFAIIAAIGFVAYLRRGARALATPEPLSEAESERLQTILSSGGGE